MYASGIVDLPGQASIIAAGFPIPRLAASLAVVGRQQEQEAPPPWMAKGPHLGEPAVRSAVSRDLDLDPARLRLLALGQRDRQYAMLVAGLDPLGVDGLGSRSLRL